jgi:hypothetical protein
MAITKPIAPSHLSAGWSHRLASSYRAVLVLGSIASGLCLAQESPRPAVKNWPVSRYCDARGNLRRDPHSNAAAGSTILTYVAITPCRLMDTRESQGFTGAFGPPSLSAYATRTVRIPSQTKCDVPNARRTL